MAVLAPVTAFGQWAILPLGATDALGAGAAELLAAAEGALGAALADAAGPEDDFWSQLSQAARSIRGRTRSRAVDRTGASKERYSLIFRGKSRLM
jgi:hypothetical protein